MQSACKARPAVRLPKSILAPFTSCKPIQTRFSIVSEGAMRDAKAVPVLDKGELNEFPGLAGVYAVLDKADVLQYIGLSRKVAACCSGLPFSELRTPTKCLEAGVY